MEVKAPLLIFALNSLFLKISGFLKIIGFKVDYMGLGWPSLEVLQIGQNVLKILSTSQDTAPVSYYIPSSLRNYY